MISNSYCDTEISKDYLWNHTLSSSPELIAFFVDILNKHLLCMSFHEAVNLYRAVERTSHVPGDIAEVGVFNGGSALIMAFANQNKKRLHLFDTFSGIPEATQGIDAVKAGDIKGNSSDMVKRTLREYDRVVDYYVGVFPDTASNIPVTSKFSLVNLDMDVYQSTKSGLEFFYPRMSAGGAIICHDYFSLSCPGVKKAVDEFFADKPETLVDLWHTQVVVIKM
jgi:O-methyltransferase